MVYPCTTDNAAARPAHKHRASVRGNGDGSALGILISGSAYHAQWDPGAAAAPRDERATGALVAQRIPEDGRITFDREGERREPQLPLGPLLCPGSSVSGPDPHGAEDTEGSGIGRGIRRTSHQGSVAVAGNRHGRALFGEAICTRAHQLRSLLRPDAAVPRPDPGGSAVAVVTIASNQGGLAISGERRRTALPSGTGGARSNQL